MFLGTSSVARAWSANLDSLTGGIIAETMRKYLPINAGILADYPDFLAVGLIILVTSKSGCCMLSRLSVFECNPKLFSVV